jgi:thioredoxin 1
MRSEELLEITDTNFDTLAAQGPLPILIDFTAAWCAPCRTIAPYVAAIAREYAGRLTVGTCDVDSNVALASRLDVRSMPTLMLFKSGQVVGQIVGAVPRAKIEALIARVVAPAPAPAVTSAV